MKIRFTQKCMDMYTLEEYNVGDVKEFKDARALDIIATGYAKKVQESELNVQECEQNIRESEFPQEIVSEYIADKMSEQQEEKLSDLKKVELIEIAKDMGVSTRGTKEDIIERILNAQA